MPKWNELASIFRNAIKPTSGGSSPSLRVPKAKLCPAAKPTEPVGPTSGGGIDSGVKGEISSLLDGSRSGGTAGLVSDVSLEKTLDAQGITNSVPQILALKRKEAIRKRKGQYIFRSGQSGRFNSVITTSSQILGSKLLETLEKLGRGAGEKEYASLINVCVDEARRSNDENEVSRCISKAVQYIKAMKERGFPLKDGTFGPLFLYMIDKGMVEQFYSLSKVISDEDCSSVPHLGYYEMRLFIRLDDVEKVEELLAKTYGDDTTALRENYLVALCDSDWEDEICQILENLDVTEVSSLDQLTRIFKSLGRLQLTSFAEKFLSALTGSDYEANISTLVFSYVSSIPNIAVEDAISRFEDLHTVLEVEPFSRSYERIVYHCCDLLKVHVALDIVDQMGEAGEPLSLSMMQRICRACDKSFEFILVRRIYSLILQYGLEPDNETFRCLISLYVKMKDIDGAFDMLRDLKKLNLKPTASMYNLIIGACFRDKNVNGALKVLRQMEDDGVAPDSSTYSYLINNCDTEEKIIEYYEKMKTLGSKQLKQVFMALINGYVTCGEYEKAKQVLWDKSIPKHNINEIKSVLVQALAMHGQVSDAMGIYEEMKEAGCAVEPKAVIALIENVLTEGPLNRLLELLQELGDHDLWLDGCHRVILYCLRHKHLSSAVHLMKQLHGRCHTDELAMEVIFDEFFVEVAEIEPTDLQMGLELLQAVKLELGLTPSRRCLDFLLDACIKAKDLKSSLFIWKEYQLAGLPYNVMSYLRMYQALLASGSRKQAKTMLSEIPRDDPHVCLVTEACKRHYCKKTSATSTGDKKKKQKKKKKTSATCTGDKTKKQKKKKK